MKTIILRIGKRGEAEDAGYPVTIHCDDAGDSWDSIPLARGTIPRDLGGLVSVGTMGQAVDARDAVVMVARREAGKPDGAKKFGEALFRLAFGDEVRERWNALRTKYPAEKPEEHKEGRRVLLDIRDPGLRRLPWELLRVPDSPIWLAGDGTNTLARVSPWPDSPGEPALADAEDEPPRFLRDATLSATDGPLRVLVVIGSEKGDKRVDAETEIRSIEDALWGLNVPKTVAAQRCCLFDLQVIRQPSRASLARKYLDYRPHVFHFIGHGAIDVSGSTRLILWTPAGELDYTIEMIYQELVARHAPELALLNCCHAAPEAWQGGVWSIAKVFLDQGARAVLGTLGSVPGSTSARMAGAFYDKLAEGWSIDQALALARVSVLQDRLPSFGMTLPYLHLGVPPEMVLSMPSLVSAKRVSQIPEFQDNVRFVNRHEERANLRAAAIARAIGRAPGAPTPTPVVLLRGNTGVGKTSLLRKAMESCAIGARQLKYVKLADHGAVGFLKLVLAIRNARTVSSTGGPIPAGSNPFAQFDATVAALTTAEGPSLPPGDERRLISSSADENACDRIAEQLLAGLAGLASSGGGLILALDELTDVEYRGLLPPEFQLLSIPKLIQPILDGKAPGVTLVIAADAVEIEALGLANLDPVPDQILLEPFPDNTFRDYAEEYCRRRRDPWAIADGTIKIFEDLIRGPWSPSVLPRKIGELNDRLNSLHPSSASTPDGRQ
jgi:CHAT domain